MFCCASFSYSESSADHAATTPLLGACQEGKTGGLCVPLEVFLVCFWRLASFLPFVRLTNSTRQIPAATLDCCSEATLSFPKSSLAGVGVKQCNWWQRTRPSRGCVIIIFFSLFANYTVLVSIGSCLNNARPCSLWLWRKIVPCPMMACGCLPTVRWKFLTQMIRGDKTRVNIACKERNRIYNSARTLQRTARNGPHSPSTIELSWKTDIEPHMTCGSRILFLNVNAHVIFFHICSTNYSADKD